MKETKKPLVHLKKFLSIFVALTLIVTLLPLGNVKAQAGDGPSLFTMASASAFTVATSTGDKTWLGSETSTLEYMTGDADWTVWDGESAITAAQREGTGDYFIMFRGKELSTISTGNKWIITAEGNVRLYGDIMTLLDFDNVPTTVANSCFSQLFMDCSAITDISGLVLSAATAGDSSYSYMFKNCTGLTDISGLTLSAATIGSWCYLEMFAGCKNITKVMSTLPATSLSQQCYSGMFKDCKKLVTPPALPATKLSWNCYYEMFKGCSKLTSTPTLPATSLSKNCYASMFEGCTLLSQFPDLSHVTCTSYDGYCTNMFKSCSGIKICTEGKGDAWSLPACLSDSKFFGGYIDGILNATLEAGKNYYYAFDVTVTAGANGSVDITSITDLAGLFTPAINGNKLKIGDTTITATPNTDYKFSSWSGLPTNTSYIAKNTNITAVFKPLHEHSAWTYSVADSAITATCNAEDTCTLPDGKVTINLSSATCSYDGEAVTYGDAEATPAADILITGYDTWLYNDLAPVVKFYNSTGAEISAPSDAGEYTVKLFAAEGSDKFVSTTLTIEKVPAVVSSEAVTASALTFSGSAQALLSTLPTTQNGDICYAVASTASTPDSFPLTADEVKATNAGTYYVFYKIMGDDNHSAKTFGPVEVSIAKRTPNFNNLSTETVKATEVTLSAISGIDNILYGINTTAEEPGTSWQDSNVFTGLTKNTDYYFFAKCDSDSNNNSSISSLGTLITTSDIDESEITGISAKADINTDGIPYGTAITVALLTNGTPVLTDAPTAEVTYSYVGVAPTTYEKSTTPPTDIGTYKLVVDMLDDSYYGVKEFEFKIVKTTPSVPSGVKATAPTSSSATDGSITGLDETMEYAVYDNSSKTYGEYQSVTDSAITGLEAGTKIKVRVKETATSNASADKELTVPSYVAPVIFIPVPAPAVETLTVPVKGDDTIRISATIKDGNAAINEITASDIEKVFEKKSGETSDEPQNTTMTIDVSEAAQNVTDVTLTRKTVETLVEAVNDKKNPLENVEIKLPEVSVTLDNKALEAVAEQAGGDVVLVVKDTGVDRLNATQKNALKNKKISTVFDAHIESNGVEIHNFNGGIAEVSIKFLREAGRDFKHYFIYYVADNGSMEKLPTRFENNRIIFKTGHLSDYVIIYDENEENDTYKAEDVTDKSDATEETPAAEPVKPAVKAPTDAQIVKNSLKLNKGLKVTSNADGIKVSWGKVADADGYIVYAAYCGKSNKKVKTIKDADVSEFVITELNGKALNLKKNFKVLVKAYKLIDGKKVVLGKTLTAHIAGCDSKKYSNPKAVKLLSGSKLTLTTGDSFAIEAKTVLADKSKKSLSDSHAKEFRFASNNTKIATVDAEGNITAKKAGKCYVYVYARNGFTKRITVVVE